MELKEVIEFDLKYFSITVVVKMSIVNKAKVLLLVPPMMFNANVSVRLTL